MWFFGSYSFLIDSSICEWSPVQYSGIACCERGSTSSGNDFMHSILQFKCHQPGLKPWLLNLEFSAVTMRPLRLPPPLCIGGLLLFYKNSINVYTITQVILAFWLVLTYDLLEDRRTIDVMITKFFLLHFKMAECFENEDIYRLLHR